SWRTLSHTPFIMSTKACASWPPLGLTGSAAERDRAALDERPALPPGAEPQVLELDQHLGGEVVVERDEVDVGGREPRHRERPRPRVHGRGDEVVRAQARVGAVLAHARADPE